MKVLMLNPPFLRRYSRSQRSPAVIKSGTLYYPIWLGYATGVLEEAGHDARLIDAPARGYELEWVKDFTRDFRPDVMVLDSSTPSFQSGRARRCGAQGRRSRSTRGLRGQPRLRNRRRVTPQGRGDRRRRARGVRLHAARARSCAPRARGSEHGGGHLLSPRLGDPAQPSTRVHLGSRQDSLGQQGVEEAPGLSRLLLLDHAVPGDHDRHLARVPISLLVLRVSPGDARSQVPPP